MIQEGPDKPSGLQNVQLPSCMEIDGWLKFLTTRFASRLRTLMLMPRRSLIPRPFFSVFICGGGKKGLVDLCRTFCSTDSQILGVVNRC